MSNKNYSIACFRSGKYIGCLSTGKPVPPEDDFSVNQKVIEACMNSRLPDVNTHERLSDETYKSICYCNDQELCTIFESLMSGKEIFFTTDDCQVIAGCSAATELIGAAIYNVKGHDFSESIEAEVLHDKKDIAAFLKQVTNVDHMVIDVKTNEGHDAHVVKFFAPLLSILLVKRS